MKKVPPFAISDARFRAFVEKSWDVLVLVDAKARVLYATPSMIRMFGRNYDEFMGMQGLKYVHPGDFAAVMKAFSKLVLSPQGTLVIFEMRIKHKDGNYKWIEAKATNLLADSEIRAVVINFHDITASKELEQQKNDFISIASHELKTPITSLKLYVRILLKESYKLQLNRQLGFIKRMEYQIDHLAHLVNDLLDVTKTQENKLFISKESFSLELLVKEVVEDMQETTTTHKIRIKILYKGNIYADKIRISQVLINLVTNAIKFSPSAKEVLVTISANKKYITLQVKDFGIGIAREDQKKIFDRFFQAGKQGSRGLGLGLYITSHIVRAHGGRFLVKSEKGKGSTFTVQIPK